MEEFFKSIKKNLETLPGFNFLNNDTEEDKPNPNVEGVIEETKYDKLVTTANESKNKGTRKRKPSKSKTKSRPKKK